MRATPSKTVRLTRFFVRGVEVAIDNFRAYLLINLRGPLRVRALVCVC